MQSIGFDEFKRDCKNVLDGVVADAECVTIIQESGKDVVLVSLREYNSWMETIHLMRSPNNYTRLTGSIIQAEQGNLVHHDLIEE